MKRWVIVGLVVALLVHAGILLFGGLLFLRGSGEHGVKKTEVDLVTEHKPDKKPEEEKPKVEEEMENEPEQMPDARDLAQLEMPPMASEAALEPLSLGALENALNPGMGGGDFGGSFGLSSGGRIGGQGTGLAGDLDAIFSMSDLDQKPRPIFQSTPLYPVALRQKKVAGSVLVSFVVDKQGKVTGAQVERSSDPAFDKPALDAVKQWKFEPGVRAGQKVHFKMRVPIKFAPA